LSGKNIEKSLIRTDFGKFFAVKIDVNTGLQRYLKTVNDDECF